MRGNLEVPPHWLPRFARGPQWKTIAPGAVHARKPPSRIRRDLRPCSTLPSGWDYLRVTPGDDRRRDSAKVAAGIDPAAPATLALVTMHPCVTTSVFG